jgi:ribonuclease HI
MVTIAYTDGASRGNPGPGGWAWAVPDGPFASGAEARTTNQRMEITAAYEAVKSLSAPLIVYSDATYVVNCFRDRWYDGWERRGWRTSANKPVANRDLWEPFIALAKERGVERGAARGGVEFRWVKGHADDRMNDVVDRLAVEAALTQRGRSGDRTPDTEELGPADAAAVGRDPRLPPGRLLLVVGHRPPELGGYDSANPVASEVRRRLTEIVAAKRELHPDLRVVTGLRLGAEQLGAEAAAAAGVPYVAVIPYPDADREWPAESRARFRQLTARAAKVIQLERKVPESRQKAGAALARRDGWLSVNVDEAVVVWNGEDAALARFVRTLQGRLGEENVWFLEP